MWYGCSKCGAWFINICWNCGNNTIASYTEKEAIEMYNNYFSQFTEKELFEKFGIVKKNKKEND